MSVEELEKRLMLVLFLRDCHSLKSKTVVLSERSSRLSTARNLLGTIWGCSEDAVLGDFKPFANVIRDQRRSSGSQANDSFRFDLFSKAGNCSRGKHGW